MSSIEQLEDAKIRGAVALLHGEIAAHQVMPRNFPFYNPESHQRLYRALDRFEPAAVIAATGVDPEMVGSQYPFPLFEDGDLLIPSAYMKDVDGERLRGREGETVTVHIDSERIDGPRRAAHCGQEGDRCRADRRGRAHRQQERFARRCR